MSQRSPFNQRNMPTSSDEKSVKGMARKSASSAKPAREAAGSVRVVSVKKDKLTGASVGKNMTKEEKKELKRKEREKDDLVYSLSEMVVKNNPIYSSRRKIWWVFMGIGMAFVVLCFAMSYVATQSGQTIYTVDTPMGIFSIVAIAIAYIGIIGALVWDWTKLRPIRNQTQLEIESMSDKRRVALYEKCNKLEEERKAKKKK